jgi:hypothetical protein
MSVSWKGLQKDALLSCGFFRAQLEGGGWSWWQSSGLYDESGCGKGSECITVMSVR